MNHVKSTIIIACSVALTACYSSGGGGGSNNTAMKEAEQKAKQLLQAEQTPPQSAPKTDTQQAETPSSAVPEKGNSATVEPSQTVKNEPKTVEPSPSQNVVKEEEPKISSNPTASSPQKAPLTVSKGENVPSEQPKISPQGEISSPVAPSKPAENLVQNEGNLTAPSSSTAQTPQPEPTQPPQEKAVETKAENVPNVLQTTLAQGFEQNAPLVGTVITLNQNGTMAGRNPMGDELEILDVAGTKITLLSATDKLNGTAFQQLKALSMKDLREGAAETISGYVGSSSEDLRDFNFKAVRYGVYRLNGTNHLFVQGQITPLEAKGELYPLPKDSVYKYSGFAVYGKDDQYRTLQSEVVANFNNKKIRVDLSEMGANQPHLTFGGKIDGNTFSGSHNGIESKGAFYGSQARDVGGVFFQTEGVEKGYNGAFGASDRRVVGGSADQTTLSEF